MDLFVWNIVSLCSNTILVWISKIIRFLTGKRPLHTRLMRMLVCFLCMEHWILDGMELKIQVFLKTKYKFLSFSWKGCGLALMAKDTCNNEIVRSSNVIKILIWNIKFLEKNYSIVVKLFLSKNKACYKAVTLVQ